VRRGSLLQLVGLTLVIAAGAAAVALFIPWLPESASEERDRIDVVFWVTTVICIAVFAVVFAISVFSLWKFRARPDDDSDGPPIHGHTGIEITWTAIPALLVTAIAVVSAVALARNDSTPADLTVDVRARQFTWSFSYPDSGNLTSSQLNLPVDKTVLLRISSDDVIHSFWVPEFGQKQDALPKPEVTELRITPTREGTFPVICTELCGAGHAFMRNFANVMSEAEFNRWSRGRQQDLNGTPQQAGRAVFEEQGCGSCHTFTPAGTSANAGPNLDELPELARRAGRPLEEFVRQSIVEPDAYVERGFGANVMPETYAQLPEQQLDALVQYLLGSGNGGS
jgi:cytochrome c oxidase subunit 2